MSTSEILKLLRDDIRQLPWEKLSDDGVRILVAKAEVLRIVQEWIEYSLEEAA